MIGAAAWPDQKLIKAEPETLIWDEPLPGGGRAVVKLYRNRGAFDPVRRLFVPYRVEREFRLLETLFVCGVPCPEPLRWSQGDNARHARHELLATREIPRAVPLKSRLRGARPAPDLAPLFGLARKMHDCGVSHGAFYPANILVSPGPGGREELHIVDLAHGCGFSRGIVGTRPADFDLLDMLRAIERVAPIDDCKYWLEGYGTGSDHVRELMSMLVKHRIERPWRHLHRAETDARAAWDRFSRAAASRGSAAAPQIPRDTQPR
jgi:tRNA A-37 threonylcarbamoyl transferase component Bud32